jgi:transcriptional regulator with XRE-family HTH domain
MSTELGEFLRSRRARLSPDGLGLPQYGRRRVPGLRREEVAQLAGVSADYYMRLEQGRNPHVSDQVLDAIARALRLTETERAHLYALARPNHRQPASPHAPVRRSLQAVLDGMGSNPAIIVDYTTTILAANALAQTVFSIGPGGRGRDRARNFFLEPAARDFFPRWEEDAVSLVAELRVQAAKRPDDPRLTALIGELSIKSAEFRALWAKHPVKDKTHGEKVINHPLAGELVLAYDRMTLPGTEDAFLYAYTAEPGSPTAERLALLASWGTDAPSTGEPSALPDTSPRAVAPD